MSNLTSTTGSTDRRGSEKLNDVTNLLDKLRVDLELKTLLPHQQDAILEQLKVYGRNPDNADPIFTVQGIGILTRYALDGPSTTTSRNALRCLANAMLLRPATRQIFVNLGYESKACSRLQGDNKDDEFLVSRIIFLTTYDTNINIKALIDQHHLADNVNHSISRHAAYLEETMSKKLPVNQIADMALTETLKLLFNVSHFCPERAQHFSPSIPPILTILQNRQVLPSKPLETPFGPLVNSLINLVLNTAEAKTALFPEKNPRVNADLFIELLGLALHSYKEEELDQQVLPLLSLMRKVYELAPVQVQIYMKTLMLPNDDDRRQPLGKSDSLSSRLLRVSTSALAPRLREEVSTLLFELSDRDALSFVQNVGYGFASGFLFQHNILIPDNALDPWSEGNSEATSSSNSREKHINPITGQAIEFEPKVGGPEMTMEEKEREAERLMVLFERLKRNGVISAENPVAKAQREGVFEDSRFTEVHSDDDD